MSKPAISTTGIKGFLQWFQREQPALYNKIAPQLPALVPKAFSNYTATQKHLRLIYKGNFSAQAKKSLGALSDYASYTLPALYVTSTSTADPIAVNYSSQLAPAYYSDPATFTTSVDAGDTPTVSVSPVSAAANSGTASNAVANAISQTVGAAASIYMTNAQAALQQSVVQSQLARAQAGLPPLNTSLNALGVPTVSTGALSSGSMLLLGGAALLAIVLSGGSAKK